MYFVDIFKLLQENPKGWCTCLVARLIYRGTSYQIFVIAALLVQFNPSCSFTVASVLIFSHILHFVHSLSLPFGYCFPYHVSQRLVYLLSGFGVHDFDKFKWFGIAIKTLADFVECFDGTVADAKS